MTEAFLEKRRSNRPRSRSLLRCGLHLLVTHMGTVLWTYAASLIVALVFSLRLHSQLASLLNHSLAAQRLNAAFDLGTLASVVDRFNQNTPSAGASSSIAIFVYLGISFILVPGSLFCYQAHAPGRISTLVAQGLQFFWRFIRIAALTVIVSIVILGPLIVAQNAWSTHVDLHHTGYDAFLRNLPGILVIALVALLLRLYFDLVEVYTVQLANQPMPSGKPDHRVRKVLLPALKTLFANLLRTYSVFVFLTLLGVMALFFTGRVAGHMLAHPSVVPAFLIGQVGILVSMAARFWQRGAETILAQDNPLDTAMVYQAPFVLDTTQTYQPRNLQPAETESCRSSNFQNSHSAESQPAFVSVAQPDALPGAEPISPSLDYPDPGIFHHEPGAMPPPRPSQDDTSST